MKTGSMLRHAATSFLIGALGVSVWGMVRQEFSPLEPIALTLIIVAIILDRLGTQTTMNAVLAEVRANNDTAERYVSPFFGATTADGNMRYFQQLKLGWSFRATSVQDRGSSIEVDRNASIMLWRDSLIDSTTWDALSFAHDLWRDDERRISEAYQALQQELGGRNRIRRVFLVESHHDLDSIMPVLAKQVQLLGHDNVRWMLRPDLMALVEQRGEHIRHSPLLRDLDFAVVNESFVLWFVLNGRELSKSRLTEVSQTVESAKRIFRMSFDNGQRLPAVTSS